MSKVIIVGSDTDRYRTYTDLLVLLVALLPENKLLILMMEIVSKYTLTCYTVQKHKFIKEY